MRGCLADGSEIEHVGMVRNIITDINGFQFEIDVIVARDKGEQDCQLILGRSFMAAARALIEL